MEEVKGQSLKLISELVINEVGDVDKRMLLLLLRFTCCSPSLLFRCLVCAFGVFLFFFALAGNLPVYNRCADAVVLPFAQCDSCAATSTLNRIEPGYGVEFLCRAINGLGLRHASTAVTSRQPHARPSGPISAWYACTFGGDRQTSLGVRAFVQLSISHLRQLAHFFCSLAATCVCAVALTMWRPLPLETICPTWLLQSIHWLFVAPTHPSPPGQRKPPQNVET